jgi:hypothetical protein
MVVFLLCVCVRAFAHTYVLQALALAVDPTLILPLFDIALVGLPTLFIGYVYIVSMCVLCVLCDWCVRLRTRRLCWHRFCCHVTRQ